MTPMVETINAPMSIEPAQPPMEAVSRPAEVVRLAAAAREVLVELRASDLGDAALNRADAAYERSLAQLSGLLSEGLRTELYQLVGAHRVERDEPPGDAQRPDTVPSVGELRVAEAQLAGWLDGLLQTMDASLAAEMSRAGEATGSEQRGDASPREPQRGMPDTAYL